MRTKIVAGNWKMNKTLAEGVALCKELQEALKDKKTLCKVIVAPPFLHLASVASVLDKGIIALSAQNCADQESGAYTGEVSAEMLSSAGVSHVIIGHSERRAYYHEDGAMLARKVKVALGHGLTPIFCVGELLEDRDKEQHFSVVEKQLNESVLSLSSEEFSRVIIAYEPVWAIGTGRTATPQQAQDMHAHIRKTISNKYGTEIANNCSILYGGSCNASNAKELFANPDVDGGLIGGASLEVAKFLPIIEAFEG